MQDINISDISIKELPQFEAQIRETVNCAFGCPGYDEDVITDLKVKNDPIIKICTDFNNQVIGFGYGYKAEAGTLSSFLKMKPKDIPSHMLSADKEGQIGIIKTIVTAPPHQGKGIGTKLVQGIEISLLRKNITRLIVPAWKASNRVNIGKTMDKTGYKEEFTVDEFWKKDCDSGNFQCADKTDKCVCSAVFYTKTP